jgi:hypothetical protein
MDLDSLIAFRASEMLRQKEYNHVGAYSASRRLDECRLAHDRATDEVLDMLRDNDDMGLAMLERRATERGPTFVPHPDLKRVVDRLIRTGS